MLTEWSKWTELGLSKVSTLHLNSGRSRSRYVIYTHMSYLVLNPFSVDTEQVNQVSCSPFKWAFVRPTEYSIAHMDIGNLFTST